MTSLATDSVVLQLMARSESSGQWIHLLPAGTFHGRDGRGPYKLGDVAAVINSSREHAGRVKMPIDYNHAIDRAEQQGKETPAAGWIDGLQARATGIWGRVQWTPRAAEQLAQREYRYLSPVFTHSHDGTVRTLLRAALTNVPNLDQLTALASMETPEMDKLPELRKLLGLPDDATIDDILARVAELSTARQSAETPDPAKFVPIGDFERVVARVNELDRGLSLQAATAHVADQIEAGRLLPFLKDWGVALCSTNKAAFDDFVKRTKGPLQQLFTQQVPGHSPSVHSAQELTAEESAVASQLGVSGKDYLKTKAARGAAE